MHGIKQRPTWIIWLGVALVVGLGGAWIGHASGIFAHQNAGTSPVAPTSCLKFEATSIQLGQVKAGLPLTCKVEFTNSGQRTIEIVETRASCGCLIPRLTQRLIGSGERGEAILEVRSLGQPAGNHTWHLKITYRDGEQYWEQPLEVHADVVAEISVQPAELTIFTRSVMSHEITLVDRRPKPLAVVGIETTSSHAKTRIAPAVIDNVGRSVFKIALHTAEDMPPGRHEEQLVIYTNDSLYREIRVPFVVIKEATRRIRAMPSEVTLNAPRMVRLRDDQNQPIHIESLAADHPAISSQWAPGPENQATIKLALDSAQTPGSGGTASVRVQISSPVREMLVIPVRWEGN